MRAQSLERRVQRSENPADALTNWLEASRVRAALESLVLADNLGILVSGSGPEEECDELAAWAPIVLQPSTRPEGIRLSGVKLPGFDAYLVTAAEPGQHAEVLHEVAQGCCRILGRPVESPVC